ncbi:MAG TPA: ABC transporter ATP-binding protein [Gaiellaceae bacterium]|nr:ABC transporter ATP-binding protein [Gaiellaceae bacterium]
MIAEREHTPAVISARHVWREFGGRWVLRDVSLEVPAGEIHALLGPNGAGKTTFLRILTGLVEASRGRVSIANTRPNPGRHRGPAPIGLIPSSDRSFYLRISGLENLVFFARLHGLSRRQAVARASEALAQVGLSQAAFKRAYEYSHGMLKRLAVARALLVDPPALLVDEATHDLDPAGAETIRTLIRDLANRGHAVIWTTQRIEEISTLADHVSVLADGEVRFRGTVDELAQRSPAATYVVTLSNGGASGERLLNLVRDAVQFKAAVAPAAGDGLYRLSLQRDAILGDVFAALSASNLTILDCREERPKVEDAFLYLTREGAE